MSNIGGNIYFNDNLLGLENTEEFAEYRALMIEEADLVLSNKKDYIQCDIPYDIKLMRISDLIDFFLLEDENTIVDELSAVEDALRIKRILSGGSSIGYLYT